MRVKIRARALEGRIVAIGMPGVSAISVVGHLPGGWSDT
jgi:hypothetical protein